MNTTLLDSYKQVFRKVERLDSEGYSKILLLYSNGIDTQAVKIIVRYQLTSNGDDVLSEDFRNVLNSKVNQHVISR